jgi:hypothetical protein
MRSKTMDKPDDIYDELNKVLDSFERKRAQDRVGTDVVGAAPRPGDSSRHDATRQHPLFTLFRAGMRGIDSAGNPWRYTASEHWVPDDAYDPGQLVNPVTPDLTDAATRGVLLEMVREAWDCPAAISVLSIGQSKVWGWRVYSCDEEGKRQNLSPLLAALTQAHASGVVGMIRTENGYKYREE